MSEKITKEEKKLIKKEKHQRFWDSILGIFIETLLVFLLGTIASGIAFVVAKLLDDSWKTANFLMIHYVPVALLGVTFIIYMALKYKDILATLKYGYKKNNIYTFLIGIGIGFFMNGLAILVAYLSGCINFKAGNLGIAGIVCFIICSMQCIAEEIISRCFIYERTIKRYSAFVAVLFSSAFFAGCHLANPGATVLSIFSTLVIGMFFALTVYYFDNIYIAFGIHSMWNFTQNFIFGLPNSGMASEASFLQLDGEQKNNIFTYNTTYGVEETIFVVILACVMSAVVIIIGCKMKNEKFSQMFKKNNKLIFYAE